MKSTNPGCFSLIMEDRRESGYIVMMLGCVFSISSVRVFKK